VPPPGEGSGIIFGYFNDDIRMYSLGASIVLNAPNEVSPAPAQLTNRSTKRCLWPNTEIR